jgi:hypothetical protein
MWPDQWLFLRQSKGNIAMSARLARDIPDLTQVTCSSFQAAGCLGRVSQTAISQATQRLRK